MKEKYTFLRNEPIGKDLFEGKSQERIAEVLVDIVEDNKFKVIGIDGEWGTGKSNLVKMVDEMLPDHQFFLYDVWGHQEDEQRKAILVELTEFISNKENSIVSNKTNWQQNLEILLANKKETTTINQPFLSVGFIFSLFSIIYIPSVNVFKDSIVDFLDIKALFWKLVLVLFPIFIVLGIYIFNLIKEWNKKSGFWSSFKLSAQETFQVYTNKQKKETKIETISEKQPSVREFRKWMKDIDNDLGNNNLVLVFDNFDRLPKKHILSIWSVIHIFFAETDYNKIKIIIPFDRKHIKNAFKEINDDRKDYANDYINKTFDIVYRVAPPILSSWKIFFKDNWKRAMKEFDLAEYLKVEQIYEVFRPQITPRELIAFINDIVALKLLDDSIPDRYLAVYVLKKEHILNNPLKAITTFDYLEGIQYLFKDDNNFDKYITALAYQIHPENSLEVVYKRQLKESLINEELDNFKRLSETNVFSRIIYSVVSELDNYNSTINMLSKISDKARISEVELHEVWDTIYMRKSKILTERGKLESFQLILLEKISHSNQVIWVNDIIENLYQDEESFNSKSFALHIDKLHHFVTDSQIDVNVFKSLHVKSINVDQFKLLIDTKNKEFTKYRLNCSREEIESYLSERTVDNFSEAEFVFYLEYKNDLSEFHELLKTFVVGNETNNELLLKLFNFMKNTATKPIENPLTDAQIYSLMNSTDYNEEFYVDLACMRICLLDGSHPSYQQVYNIALDSEDEGLHYKVALEIENYMSLRDLLIGSITFNRPLVSGVLPLVLEQGKSRSLNIREILKNTVEICDANGLDSEILLKKLSRYKYGNFEYEFLEKLDIAFYSLAKSSKTQIGKDIVDTFNSHFANGEGEIWDSVFQDFNGRELEILQHLGFVGWNSYTVNSLKNRLKTLIDDQNIDQLKMAKSIIDELKNSGKGLVNTFKDLRDHIISTNSFSLHQFNILMPYLVEFGSLTDKSADVIRTMFKIEFLDNEKSLNIMIEHSTVLKELLSHCKAAEKSDFSEAVRDRIENFEVIERLAKLIGIGKRRDKKADKNEESEK